MKTSSPFWLFFISALLLLGGCQKKTNHIIVQLDWVAEPEHGGFYQALAKGYFKEAGLEVEILPGGANAFVMQKVASAQAHIGQADSTNTILAVAQGAPLTCIGAVFQNDPSVLMLHAESPIKDFAKLDGQTIVARPEWAFLPYLKKKYGINFKEVPQNFSVANFIVDKNYIQQGYYIAEPFHIVKGGAKPPKFLYAWDAGFDAYTVLIANRAWADAHPDQLRAFMRAYIRGWRDYLEGDPAPAHTLMKQVNANNTDEFLAFSRQMIIDEKLVIGRSESSTAHIGKITPARFQTQLNQLRELGILTHTNLRPEDVMTTRYLP
jgi:NitT/TauT family transport system substrate-binding protein